MRKVIVVAVREYLAAVRTKAFIITILLMPVLMGSGFIAEKFLGDASMDTSDRRIAIIDHSDALYGTLASAAESRNAHDIFSEPTETEDPEQIVPRFLLERVQPDPDAPDELLLALSERVRDGELLAFIEIAPDVFIPADDDLAQPAVKYYTNSPTYRDARVWLRATINDTVQTSRFHDSGLDVEQVSLALQPTRVDQFGLLARDAATGEITQPDEVNQKLSVIVPFLLVVVMFMVIMMAAGPLIQSVLEEKMQRIAEVLLGCIDPFRWMMGKLIGMVGVSLTIVAIYIGGGLIIAYEKGVLSLLPLHLIGWFAAYQILAVLMYGAVFVGVGAACSDHREAQTALTPLMMLIMVPMLLLESVIREPNSTMATVLSLVPPVTPIVMLTRQAIPPGVPSWQPPLGMALVLATTVFCVFAAGRVFRVGILMQGQGARPRDMLRWVIKG